MHQAYLKNPQVIWDLSKNILPFHYNNLLKEKNKMYAQSPCTLINEFVHRLLCESKIPRSVIPQ